jgi:hypothetical protein
MPEKEQLDDIKRLLVVLLIKLGATSDEIALGTGSGFRPGSTDVSIEEDQEDRQTAGVTDDARRGPNPRAHKGTCWHCGFGAADEGFQGDLQGHSRPSRYGV